MKTTANKLKKSLNEVFFIEPNDLGLGFLNYLYKKTTHPLKYAPFIIVIPMAFLAAVAMYFIFGQLLIKLVSLLQYGF